MPEETKTKAKPPPPDMKNVVKVYEGAKEKPKKEK